MTKEMRIGAPTSPRAGIQRGTSRARYSAVPSIRALNGAMLLPRTIAQLRIATSARGDRDERLAVRAGRDLLAQRDDREQADDARS